jgi:group I intron endonuclease
VYLTTNLITGKIYIGQHTTYNMNDTYLGSGTDFKKDVKQYGRGNFERVVLECGMQNQKELDEREIFWVAELNARDKTIGYNILPGGSGIHLEHQSAESNRKRSVKMSGRKHSKERCEINRLSHLGKEQTEEHRRNESISHQGQKPTTKCVERCIEVNTGMKRSEETKRLQREAKARLPIQTCEWCGLQSKNPANMKRYHGDNCKCNPNYIQKPDTRELKTCIWCGFQSKGNNIIVQYHNDNCKHKQLQQVS